MATGIRRIVIMDAESVQNGATGDRVKTVAHASAFAAQVDYVGVNTAQVGQVQGYRLTYSIEIPRVLYKEQKFAYFDGDLYEIKMLTKAKKSIDVLLNVQPLKDGLMKKAAEDWIRENL